MREANMLNVSLKVLQNTQYEIVPIWHKEKAGKYEENLKGINLVYKNSKRSVWERSGGLIKVDEISPEGLQFVIQNFTDRARLKIFEDIGD